MSKKSVVPASAVAGLVCSCTPFFAQGAETTTYTYDAHGRLNKAQISGGPSNGAEVSYTHDKAHNRTEYKVVGSTSNGVITVTPFGNTANTTSAGVVLGVNIAGTGSPGGVVTFSENGTFLGSAWVYDGQASIILEGFPVGVHTITASYSGDSANAPNTYTFTIRVQNLSWLPAVLEILLSE